MYIYVLVCKWFYMFDITSNIYSNGDCIYKFNTLFIKIKKKPVEKLRQIYEKWFKKIVDIFINRYFPLC